MHFILLLAVMRALFPAQQPAHKQSDEIEKDELAQYLARQNDCERPDQIWVDCLEESYKSRIAELQKLTGPAKKANESRSAKQL